MTLTIAIINYNYGRYLEQAVTSALIQQSAGVEVNVLVIDDGSTDCSDEVLGKYAGERRLRVSKTANMGFGASLARAIQEATGEWVMLMDADDWFVENKLNVIAPLLTSRMHFVANQNRFVNSEGRESGLVASGGNTSTLTIRRSVALDVLPVNDESGFHLIDQAGWGSSIPDGLTYHRIHSSSLSADQGTEFQRRADSYLRVVGKLAQWTTGGPTWMSGENRRKAERFYRSMASFSGAEASIHKRSRGKAFRCGFQFLLVSRDWPSGLKLLVRAVLLRPIPSREKIFLSP